jgi:hypothetical protein
MIKTVGEFVNLVAQMRDAQKQYFRSRGSSELNVSKALEKKVDDEIKDFYKRQSDKKQPGLGI